MPTAAENLIGWWRLNEETAAEDVIDYSGNGDDGTPLGSGGANNLPQPVEDVPATLAALVRSKDFDGTDDRVSTPVFPSGNSHTLCGWIVWDVLGNNVGGLAGCHDNANHRLYVDLASDRIRYGLGTLNRDSGVNPGTGAWNHIAITGNGSTATLYRNGTAIDSASYSMSGTSGDPVLIGARTFSGAASSFLNGRLCDVRYYNVALSAEQVAAIYAGDLATPGGTARPTIGGALVSGDIPRRGTVF